MVVQLGDTVQINDIERYIGDRRLVKWSQGFGQEKAVEFIFTPFKSGDGFAAVEFSRIADFRALCRVVPANEDDWGHLTPCLEFEITNQFKYGQNNEMTFRFVIFMDPSYKPYQHRFTSAFEGTEDSLGAFSFLKSHVGDDLWSF
ncbi:hypothetical protein BGX21_006016 [Mortierella sp. AD011]|nr:hypothetical protein BGX20_001293 [Mortierella sp. AD010]KAF9369313.1 hypothetical protein BGX21_006016 [Mortierella sp. AD011]